MAGYDELKIQVGFELDSGVGTDLEKQLSALSKKKDFKIDAKIGVSEKDIKSLERLENVLDKFNQTNGADLNKIGQIARVFSSFKIDESVVANIGKVQKSLESFSKLSVTLQKKLADTSPFEDIGEEAKEATKELGKLEKQTEEVSKALKSNNAKKVLSDYSKITNEVKKFTKAQKEAAKAGDQKTLDYSSKQVLELGRERKALKETAKALEDYGKIKKDIKSIDDRFNRDVGLKDANIIDKIESSNYKHLLSTYKEIAGEINKLAQVQRKAFDSNDKGLFDSSTEQIKALQKRKRIIEEETTSLRDYGKASKEIASINKKNRDTLNNVDANRNDNALKKQQKDAEELAKSYDKLGKSIKTNLDKASSMKDNNLLKDTNIDKVYNDLVKMSKINLSNLGKADVDQLTNKLNRAKDSLQELTKAASSNKKMEINNLKVDKIEKEFKSLEAQIRQTFGESHADNMVRDLEQIRKAANKSGDEFDIMARKWSNSMDDVKKSMKSVSSDVSSNGGFFGDFYDNLFTFTAGELLADGIRSVGYALKDMVMEYDHAMTSLKKVANPADIMNQGQLEAIEQKAVQIAKNVGGASQDVILAIADTIQMSGRSMEESMVIAEQTMMLANVAEMTQESASQAVVSMMAAFNLDPLKEVPVLVDGVTKSTTELTNGLDAVNYVGESLPLY